MTLIDSPSHHAAPPLAPDATSDPSEMPDASAAPLAAGLARLELSVQFELAGPEMSLADIAALSAEDVLELPMAVDQARVNIVVARQRVGLGELVAVGGRLGVRIVRMDLLDGPEAAA